MSYYFNFQQVPTKEINEVWEQFFDQTLGARVNQELETLEQEGKEVEGLPTFGPDDGDSSFNFEAMSMRFNDRAKYDVLAENSAKIQSVHTRRDRWRKIKTAMQELEHLMATKDKKTILKGIGELSAAIEEMYQKLCTGYSESCRDLDYIFLSRLFESVMEFNLDDGKVIPTIADWQTFFQRINKERIHAALEEVYEEDRTAEDGKEWMKNFCLKLLFEVRDLAKTCIEKGWDLEFTSEYWEMPEDYAPEAAKLERLYERVMARGV